MERRYRAILPPEEGNFTSKDVCKLAEVSPRQLQWWDERDVISPHKHGHRRVYAVSDVIGMMVTGELRRKGLSLQKIRDSVRSVRREIERRADELMSGKSEIYMLTDGRGSFLEDEPTRIIERLKKSRKPLYLVSVSDQVKRLTEFQKHTSGRKRRPNQLKLF